MLTITGCTHSVGAFFQQAKRWFVLLFKNRVPLGSIDVKFLPLRDEMDRVKKFDASKLLRLLPISIRVSGDEEQGTETAETQMYKEVRAASRTEVTPLFAPLTLSKMGIRYRRACLLLGLWGLGVATGICIANADDTPWDIPAEPHFVNVPGGFHPENSSRTSTSTMSPSSVLSPGAALAVPEKKGITGWWSRHQLRYKANKKAAEEAKEKPVPESKIIQVGPRSTAIKVDPLLRVPVALRGLSPALPIGFYRVVVQPGLSGQEKKLVLYWKEQPQQVISVFRTTTQAGHYTPTPRVMPPASVDTDEASKMFPKTQERPIVPEPPFPAASPYHVDLHMVHGGREAVITLDEVLQKALPNGKIPPAKPLPALHFESQLLPVLPY